MGHPFLKLLLGPHPEYGTKGFNYSAALSKGEGIKILLGSITLIQLKYRRAATWVN